MANVLPFYGQTRVDITPELAKFIWENCNNSNYRNFRKTRGEAYAEMMRNGQWQRNEEPITFDRSGQIKNGQHRIYAIMKSGITLKDWPIAYVDEHIIAFDMGLTRFYGDYHKASTGTPISNSLSGALNFITNGYERNHGKSPSYQTRLDYFNAHQEALTSAEAFSRKGNNDHACLRKTGCIAAIYCAIRMELLDTQQLETFCEICNTGFPISGAVCESALALRRSFDESINFVKSAADFPVQCMDITWQALNRFKQKSTSRRLFKPVGCIASVKEKMTMLDSLGQQTSVEDRFQ